MSRPVAVVLYVVAMAAVIVGADFAFFRRIWRWAALALIGCVIGGFALTLVLQHYTRLEEMKSRQQPELRAQELIHAGRGILGGAQAIILVHVVESNPDDPSRAKINSAMRRNPAVLAPPSPPTSLALS